MPKISISRASSYGRTCSWIRWNAASRSGTIFWLPTTRISFSAPAEMAPIWLPLAETTTSWPASVMAWTLLIMRSGVAPSFTISRPWVVRSIFKVCLRTKSNSSDPISVSNNPMSSSVFDFPEWIRMPSGIRFNTSSFASAPVWTTTTSKLRACRWAASLPTVAADAGAVKSVMVMAIANLLLTTVVVATIDGTRLRSRTIPSSVSEVKLKRPRASQDQVGTWINLQQTFRVIQARIDERLRAETDLSWPEFELLMRLELAAAHPLQMSEIAAQLVGSPSGTTRIADRLEKDGLIVRETPRENRRIVRVQLTNHGRKVLGEANQTFHNALQETFGDHHGDNEVAELRRTLRHLLEKNDAWQEARCNPTLAKPR